MVKFLLFLVLVATIGTDVKATLTLDDASQRNKNSNLRSKRLIATTMIDETYTVDADFEQGTLVNVNHQLVHDQLQLNDAAEPFGFIWVAASDRGTVVKIDTETGAILGEYRTAPQQNGNPSRTTVDHDGSVWVANRADVYDSFGSIVHIGLLENGQCEDRNNNGKIDTSIGLGDIKGWTDSTGLRGVETADDECIVHYLKVSSTGTRHISVDTNNDVWVSGLTTRKFDKVKGGNYKIDGSGTILRTEGPAPGGYYGGYGGLIDKKGVIWSAKEFLRWDTSKPLTGKNGLNWYGTKFDSYGTCIDSKGNVWVTTHSKGTIRKYDPDGKVLGNYKHGNKDAQGCVVDLNDDVWVAHSKSSKTVGHLKNNGLFVSTINVNDSASGGIGVCDGPTGVAVDRKGKIWATCFYSNTVVRIDPATGKVDKTVQLGSGAGPYNYSDMTGSTLGTPALKGTWTVVFDGHAESYSWDQTYLEWIAVSQGSAKLEVRVQSSNDNISWSAEVAAKNSNSLSGVEVGRYLKVIVEFERAKADDASPILQQLRIHSEQGNEDAPPVAVCKEELRVSTDSGSNNAQVDASRVDDGSYDVDPLDKLSFSLIPPGPFDIGTTSVQLVVKDSSGQPATCNSKIIVQNGPVNNKPKAVCKDVIVAVDTSTQEVPVTAADVGSGSTDLEDAAGLLKLSLTPSSGSYTVGKYAVTLTVEDSGGLQDNCAATIIINQRPEAICKDVTATVSTSTEKATVAAADVGSGSTDHENTFNELELSLDPPGPYSVGQTSVTLKVEDKDGAVDTCTSTIIVKQKPDAACEDVTVPTDAGLCTAAVSPNLVGGDSTDDGGLANLDLFLSPTGPFSLGTTTVQLTVTDADDLQDTCNAKITVEDKSPPFHDGTYPELCLWPPNHNYWATDAATFITASDNCDGIKLSGSIKRCTSNQPVDSIGDGAFINDCVVVNGKLYIRAERQGNEPPGRLYTITATVTDKAGNSADFTRIVSVPHDGDPSVKNCIKATLKNKKRVLRGNDAE